MARSLHKVQKQISKKRGVKPTALHENSRDAKRLRQAGAREDKLVRIMNAAQKAQQHYGIVARRTIYGRVIADGEVVDRVTWFQDIMANDTTPKTDENIHELVNLYVNQTPHGKERL